MGKHIRRTALLVIVLAVAQALPVRAQKHKPVPPPRPTQSTDRLHEMAKKSGGQFTLRYKPNHSALFANVGELAKRSDLIVVGRTLAHRSSLRPDGNFITQDFLVKVQEVIKGELPNARSITITLSGGGHRFSDGTSTAVWPVGVRLVEDSGIYVFFLKSPKKNSPFKGYLLVSELQGVFALTGGSVEPADESADHPLVRNYQHMPAADFLGEIHRAVPRKARKEGVNGK